MASRAGARSPRVLCVILAVALSAPGVVEAICAFPPARPGAEVVNPFVTPYIYSASNATYEAYKGFGPSLPVNASPTSLGTLAASFDYNDIAAPDGNHWQTDEEDREGVPGVEWQAYLFYVSSALSNASSIVFHWLGQAAYRTHGAERTYLLAYNFVVARWDMLANVSFSVPADKAVDGEITRNVSSYLSSNQIVVLVASEQSAPLDLTNVGRPGGPRLQSTYIATDYVELHAFLPTSVPAFAVPFAYNASVYGQVTFRGPTIVEEGNITVASGGTLTLDHARLVMNGSDTWIRVEAGGSLRVVNGSVVTDSPSDTDDGGAGDLHYHIEVLAGGELYLSDSRIENAGVPGGPPSALGLFLQDATGVLCESAVVGRETAVVADHLVNMTWQDVMLNNSGGATPELQLSNETRVDAIGFNFTTLTVTPDSMLILRTAIEAVVEDTSGKPIRGADLKMTDNGAATYASPGFGGSDPRTGRVTNFDDAPQPNILRAVQKVYLGSVTPTTNVTQISAKYFAWSDTRTVATDSPHVERFSMSLPTTTFADVAAAWTFDDQPKNLSHFDSFGPAVALADYNGDGLMDVFIAGGATRGEAETESAEANHLYRHEANNRFTEVTGAAGLASRGATAAAWGDYDNDGRPDLYLVYQGYGTDQTLLWPGVRNALYHNNGDGTFTNVTAAAGVGDAGHGSCAAWGDYDGDGFLDLYVGNVGWVLGWLVRNESNALFHNNRDGTFTDVAASLGVTGGPATRAGTSKQTLIFLGGDNATELARDSPSGGGFTQAVAWLDYDRDGDLDLYLANDFGPPVLYRNDGGTFTVVTQQAGLRRVGSARGVQVADIDGDGWLDVVQANRWVDFVWRNNHDGTFTDIAGQLGLDEELPGTTPVPLDFDMDGRVDLFVGGGRTSTFHDYAPAFLWHNEGTGAFADVTASAGVATGNNRTMGAAAADLNGDGRPDLVTANADRRNSLFINQGAPQPWLKVHLQGTASPRDGQGAQVALLAPGAGQGNVQQVGAVGARGSQQPGELLFALPGLAPTPSAPWTLDILWSSGIRQRVNVTASSVVMTVVERSALSIAPVAPIVVGEDTNVTLSAAVVSNDPRASSSLQVEWHLDTPDGPLDLNGASAQARFATPGHFFGNVTARDRSGSTAAATVEVTVRDTTPPVIPDLPNLAAVTGALISFSGTAVSDNDPTFADSGNWSWSFIEGGERVTLYGRTAAHAFAQPGDFEVTLTVRDAANNSASKAFVASVTTPQGLGLREFAILLFIVIAAGVAALAVLRGRARKLEERERAEAARKEQARRAGRAKKKKPARPVDDDDGGEPGEDETASKKRLR